MGNISLPLAARYLVWFVMTNHVHFLMTPETKDSISKVMQSLGRRYVQYFNVTYHRTGTLWEGRYKATVMDTERYLLVCSRYIELNPVRANMVGHPGEYRWSSYHVNASGRKDPLVEAHELYQALGNTPQDRQATYRALFKAHIDDKILNKIRRATQKGWALGNSRFEDEIERLLNRRAHPLSRGGNHQSAVFRGGRG